jgi:microcystin-dependent protein
MAKTKISEYSATSADNTDISNINIAEGCSPANVNNAIRTVMAQLKDQQAGTSGDPFTCTGTLTSSGTLAVTGGLTLDGAAGTSGQVMVSAGTGNTPTWGNAFVAGMIMLWSGSSATIPSGWLLCDGSSSTPDLRNRFVVGATSTYAVGATGGSADAIVVSHNHTTSSEGTHRHTLWAWNSTGSDDAVDGFANTSTSTAIGGEQANPQAYITQTGVGTYLMETAGSHTHTISTTGASGTNANLPPYYALCYIMKS